MGTSTAQRSPRTPEWERVRDLYREGARDPGELARRIVQALEPRTRTQMHGPGVIACLDTLLTGARSAARTPPEGVLARATNALAASSLLRCEAERRLAVGRLGSRFADLALDALGSCVVDALSAGHPLTSLADFAAIPVSRLGEFHSQERLHELARGFFGDDVDRCFRYFVTRDISEFVGTTGVPTVQDAMGVADAVASYCRARSADLPFASYERVWSEAGLLPERERIGRLHEPLRELMDASLSSIIGG